MDSNPGHCRYGTGLAVITPPQNSRLACTGDFASFDTGIHDDQYVRVLTLEAANQTRLVWISFDLLFVDRALHTRLATYLASRYQVAPGLATIAAVHNHNAAAEPGFNPTGTLPDYPEMLYQQAVSAIDTAFARLRPGTLAVRRTHSDLNIQRRVVHDGLATAGPNYEATRDTELVVYTVTDDAGYLASCVVVWACHPVFYPDRTVLTGEFPARLCQLLSTQWYGCQPLFFQSAAGDARPKASVVDGRFAPRGFAVIDSFARQLATEVIALVGTEPTPVALAPEALAFSVALPLDPASSDKLEQIAQTSEPAYYPAIAHAQRLLASQAPHVVQLECTLVRLTAADRPHQWWATMGGEPVGEIKELVRAQVPGPLTFIGYTDATGYIVCDRMLPEGGYEVTCGTTFGLAGPFAPGIDARIGHAFATAAAHLDSDHGAKKGIRDGTHSGVID